MASYSATFSGDLTTYIAGKIFDAANMAKAERKRAEEEAKKYGTDPQLKRGEFFGRALQSQFGGDLYNRTLGIFDPRKKHDETDRRSNREARYSAQFRYPDRLMKGQSVRDPLMGTPAHVRNLPEYQRLASKEEREYKSQVKPTSRMAATTTPEDMFGGKNDAVKVKDPKLGVFLAAVAESINASINSINSKLDETEAGVIEAKEGIAGTIKQLEYNADSLEQRLDAIIATLREQMQQAKKQTDKQEVKDKADEIKLQSDLSGTQRYVGLGEDPNQVRQLNMFEDQMRDRGPQQLDLPLDDDKQGFESGGIATGPDSGYYAKLHGNEMVIPIDNNYTQGQPSAIDGKIRKYEEGALGNKSTGTTSVDKLDNMFSKAITNIAGENQNRSSNKEEAEKVFDAAQLIPKATGIVTLGLLEDSLGLMGPLAGAVAPMIKMVSAPVAASFGVPDTITNNLIKQQETKTQERTRAKVNAAPTPASTSDGQQKSSGGFKWWNPFTWFRGNKKDQKGGTGGGGGRAGRGGTGGPGSWVKNALSTGTNYVRNMFGGAKPKGLQGAPLKRIMHGTAEGVPDLIRNTGFREQTGMIGKGVYGSVKGWVADTYRGAGKWKGILPGQGPRLDMLVPQSSRTLRGATVVSARQANRGLRIAEGILSGKYTGAKAQQLLPLLTKATPTMAQAAGGAALGAAKLGGKLLGILGPILDVAFPEGVGTYSELSGPNAYYNAPGYKGPMPMSSPQTGVAKAATVSNQSQQQSLSRMNRGTTADLKPIVLNNVQSMNNSSDDVPIRPIATVGTHGLTDFYPSVAP